MTLERWAEVERLFDELVELSSEERGSRLGALAGSDPGLAREVAQLLAADAGAAAFLGEPVWNLAPSLLSAALEEPEEAALAAGDRLGAWRLVRPLGRGGMGEVWEVERADGRYQQRAALKLLKRGLDSEQVLRRFRTEQQILARLEHPSIARLYDGGIAPDGRPFYVMELVAGRPITEAGAGLAVEERLRRLLTVCAAVEAAHRALVVHRDLKPSNILVTATGEVKLLDFGIAKLLSEEGEETRTRLEERALTPAYAAPEQILGEPVTTATDVYALGVVLYEVLTGYRPHRRQGATPARLAEEVARETVERPSTAVLRAAQPGQPAPLRLVRRLRGDLDWIVLRALAREPARRYPSAAALAADLRRHLAAEPVEARPDSLGYRGGRFVRRHRVSVAAGALVLLSLVAGLAAALVQGARAREEARRAERVRGFLVSIFEGLDPDRGPGRNALAREVLEQGAARIADLDAEPEVQADLFEALARANRALGLYDVAAAQATRALELRRRSYGEPSRAVADSLVTLGMLASASQDLAGGERTLRRALAMAEETAGPESAETARAQLELGWNLSAQQKHAEAGALLRHAYRVLRHRHGFSSPATLDAAHRLGYQLTDSGQRGEAEELLREAMASPELAGGRQPVTAAALRLDLAYALSVSDRPVEALREADAALAAFERLLGPEHELTVLALRVRARVRQRQGDWEAARADFEEARARLVRLRADHPQAAVIAGDVAIIEFHQGNVPRALELFRLQLDTVEREYGADNPVAGEQRVALAAMLASAGRYEEVLELLGSALDDDADAARRVSIMDRIEGLAALSHSLRSLGRAEEAVALGEEALRVLATDPQAPEDHTASVKAELARSLLQRDAPGDLDRAAVLARAALDYGAQLRAHAFGAAAVYAEVELARGRPAEARRELESFIARQEAEGQGSTVDTAEARLWLGVALARVGERERAQRELEAAYDLLFRRRGAGHAATRRASAELAALRSGPR